VTLTVPARLPAPYVHVDNRGMVICNGAQCVSIAASQMRTYAETFRIITAEGRATRSQGPHVVGGYVSGDDVVLYAGTHDDLISVTLTRSDFGSLCEAMAPHAR
jgi:hypothetical protein